MNTKTMKILYWVLMGLFSLFILMDAMGGLVQAKEGIKALNELGYPIYLMRFFAVLKILGVIALLTPKFPRLREWAFAGFAFNFIGAFFSWAMAGNTSNLIFPVIALALLLGIYFLEKKGVPNIAAY